MPGATGSAIKAGEAFVALFVDDNALKRGLKSAAKDMKAFGKAAATIGAGLVGIGGAALAPITVGFADLMERAAGLRQLSVRTGESVENLSKLGYAAKRSGLDLEALGDMSKHLNKHLYEATHGGAEAAASFEALGLSAEELSGMGLEDKIFAISEQFKKLTNQTDRSALAQKLFGKSGEQVERFLDRGEAGIRKLMTQAEKFGHVLTDADAESLKEFGETLENLKDAGSGVFLSLGKALIPGLDDLDKFNEKLADVVVGIRLWIDQNGPLIALGFKVAAVTVAVGTGLVVLGGIFTGLGSIITTVTALAGTFWTVLTGPLGLIVVGGALAVAALTAVWASTEEGQGVIERAGEDWLSAWGGIIAAVQSGDLEGAFGIAWSAVKVTAVDTLGSIAGLVNDTFTDVLPKQITDAIGKNPVDQVVSLWTGGVMMIWESFSFLYAELKKGWREAFSKEALKEFREQIDIIGNAALEVRKDASEGNGSKAFWEQKAADARKDLAERVNAAKLPKRNDEATKAPPQAKKIGDALRGLPAHAAGSSSGYALSQSFAISDKISERIADGIDGVNEKLDKLPDKLADKIQPKHG